MYDALTGRFTFPCPARGEARVTLSAFRQLERLPGAAHPAVFQVLFACGCGEEHEGLVTHDELDWAPLGLRGGRLLQPDDRAARPLRGRARRDSPRAGSRRGVAVELLLLPGGAPAARLPVLLLPARAGRRLARPRRPLPGLPRGLGQPRLARARRPAVPQRPGGRSGGARLQRRRRRAVEDFRAELYSALVRPRVACTL